MLYVHTCLIISLIKQLFLKSKKSFDKDTHVLHIFSLKVSVWLWLMWKIARRFPEQLVPLVLYTANSLISFCGQKCRDGGVSYVKWTQNNQHRNTGWPKYSNILHCDKNSEIQKEPQKDNRPKFSFFKFSKQFKPFIPLALKVYIFEDFH